MTSHNNLQGRSIMPSLTVNNIEASLSFFKALGFEVEEPWSVDGVMLGAMIRGGEARLSLVQDDGKKGLDRVKGVGVRIYIEADGDIDAVAARARAAGITLVKDPHDTDWGTRSFDVTEPSGFLLTIASPAKP